MGKPQRKNISKKRGVRPNGSFCKFEFKYSLFIKTKTVIIFILSIIVFTLARLLHFEELFDYSRNIIFIITCLNMLKYNFVSVVGELCSVYSAIGVGAALMGI